MTKPLKRVLIQIKSPCGLLLPTATVKLKPGEDLASWFERHDDRAPGEDLASWFERHDRARWRRERRAAGRRRRARL